MFLVTAQSSVKKYNLIAVVSVNNSGLVTIYIFPCTYDDNPDILHYYRCRFMFHCSGVQCVYLASVWFSSNTRAMSDIHANEESHVKSVRKPTAPATP